MTSNIGPVCWFLVSVTLSEISIPLLLIINLTAINNPLSLLLKGKLQLYT
jgi:hypothetical protein